MENTCEVTSWRAPCEEFHQSGGGRRAGYFGLDNTLIPGCSLFLLAQGLHDRRFYRADDMARFAWRQLMFRIRPTPTPPALESSKDAALDFVRGRPRPEVRALAREIAGERIVPRVFPDMAARIVHHLSAGDVTILATAAPVELAEIVAEGLGMTGALGTEAEVDDTDRYSGRLAGSILRGEAKAEAVKAHAQAAGIDLAASVAYSDSIRDLPMLELVGQAEVVNPDRRLRHVAEARGWPVHTVRPARSRGVRPGGHGGSGHRRRDAAVPSGRPTADGTTAANGKLRRQSSTVLYDRLTELGLSSVAGLPETAPNVRSAQFTVDDPDALVQQLEHSGRFRRDTRLGAVFHPRQISLREVAPSHSLHISIGDGNRVSAHVDRYSPLANKQPEGRCRYSVLRIAAHNIAGLAGDVLRLLPGRRR